MKKKKILVISDHPLSPSGVGTQTKYMIEALLKTGRYRFICLGGAIKHADYTPIKVDHWGEDWQIFPIDGYGNHEIIRSILQKEKPDMLWFMTDPRFYEWLWEIENEIRSNVPMVYYHVWDNFPAPHYNGRYYRSTDEVICISKVTHKILQEVTPEVSSRYFPHAVPLSVFYQRKSPEDKAKISELRERMTSVAAGENLKNPKKKIFFWNSRNARRKQSGTLIWWFKEFLDDVGHDKATLVMHTDARDPHGQDLPHLIEHLGLGAGQILLSTNAEGFGLSTLESLSCGTPIIVNMTGGLQEQATDGKNWFGWGIQPSSKAIIGSLSVPYIYEDRISQDDFNSVMKKALALTDSKYKKMAQLGMQHVHNNYNFENLEKNWVKVMDEIIEKYGSWDTRTGYERWRLLEVA